MCAGSFEPQTHAGLGRGLACACEAVLRAGEVGKALFLPWRLLLTERDKHNMRNSHSQRGMRCCPNNGEEGNQAFIEISMRQVLYVCCLISL